MISGYHQRGGLKVPCEENWRMFHILLGIVPWHGSHPGRGPIVTVRRERHIRYPVCNGTAHQAAAKRGVCPRVQAANNPPTTVSRSGSMYPFAITASTPRIKSSKSSPGYREWIRLPNSSP